MNREALLLALLLPPEPNGQRRGTPLSRSAEPDPLKATTGRRSTQAAPFTGSGTTSAPTLILSR